MLQESAIIAVFGTLLGLLIGIGVLRDPVGGDLGRQPRSVHVPACPYGQLVVIPWSPRWRASSRPILPARRAARLDILKAVSSE